jgi:vancomycin resistance protein YoaR
VRGHRAIVRRALVVGVFVLTVVALGALLVESVGLAGAPTPSIAGGAPPIAPPREEPFVPMAATLAAADPPFAPPSLIAGLITGQAILSEHTTSFLFEGPEAPRATNIRRAAELLDGITIAPSARFSFNDAVGERTRARGFVHARILRGGSYDEGVGGGICQLASTIFVAALNAGLPIERARPHSRLQRYAPPGMDVAISWQRSDLVFVNDYDVPLTLEIELVPGEHEEAIHVALVGDTAPREVEIVLHTHRELTIPERERIDRRLAPGERVVVFEGVRGAEVRRRRTIRYPEGRTVVERHDLRYPPVAREIRVSR